MRIFWGAVFVTILVISTGCTESAGELKEPIALEKVPVDILKIAQEKYPDVVFDAAYTEIEDGQSVYEFKGKSKTGKNYEVEVTKDGKILNL